jgi:5'-3' exonuclease
MNLNYLYLLPYILSLHLEMGITDLFKTLRRYDNLIRREKIFNVCFGKFIPMDISSYIYKFKAVAPDNQRWVTTLVNMITWFKSKHLIGICMVFDGKPPKEKDRTKSERSDEKKKMLQNIETLECDLITYQAEGIITDFLIETMNKINIADERNGRKYDVHDDNSVVSRFLGSAGKRAAVPKSDAKETKDVKDNKVIIELDKLEKRKEKMESQVSCGPTGDDINLVKEILDNFGVPYFQASGEAETFCAQLCKAGLADTVISEDSDVLSYGTVKTLISKIEISTGDCDVVHLVDVHRALEMTHKEFLDFCILCGTDYNKNAKKLGPVTALKFIQKYKSIERVMLNETKYDYSEYKNKEDVRNIFNLVKLHTAIIGNQSRVKRDSRGKDLYRERNAKMEDLSEYKEIYRIPAWEDKDIKIVLDFLDSKSIKYSQKTIEKWISERVEVEFVVDDEDDDK